ncbi:MAG: HDOD domain-containing protein [Betaproteobacteria bacterium]|nr:HDOD domain-containing protein [Betaproteobacteria bacterium]
MNIEAAASVAPNVPSNPFPALPQEDERDLRDLFARWEDLAKSEHSMPPVSPLIFRLLRMDRDAPLAVGEVTEIVESDPILTARLLGLANSALFVRPGKPISDVKSAVIRLGINEAFEETFTQLFGMWVRHISLYLADHLHDAVTQHEAWSFQTPSAYPLGCIPHVPENVTAALVALGLDDKLEGIIERVALQSARIESLARMP